MRSRSKPDIYYIRYVDTSLHGVILRGAETYQAALRLRDLARAKGTASVEIYQRANIRLLKCGIWQFEEQRVEVRGGKS